MRILLISLLLGLLIADPANSQGKLKPEMSLFLEKVNLDSRLDSVQDWLADERLTQGELVARGRKFREKRWEEFGRVRGFSREEHAFLKRTMDPDEFRAMWVEQGEENQRITKEMNLSFTRDLRKELSSDEWIELMSQYIRDCFPRYGTRLFEIPDVAPMLESNLDPEVAITANQQFIQQESKLLAQELRELQAEMSELINSEVSQRMSEELKALQNGSQLPPYYPEPIFEVVPRNN